jgi:dTDP-4-dehydrorhamnose reductase
MRVLILGGSGMLGHKLWQAFSPRFDTLATFRSTTEAYARFGIFDESRAVEGLSAENTDDFARAIAAVRPEVIVNCVGIVKQDAAAHDPVPAITVNALFPHKLAGICRAAGVRLVHLSTDCVFSGRKGNYSEADTTDAEDLYGRTKLIGEVGGQNCLTIRTSMIGRELEGTHGLLEWFLSQEGKRVRGFNRAVFSGFTTNALAELLGEVISRHPALSGVYHVAAEPINKFDLLSLIKETYGLRVEIKPDESFVCDRSLNGTRFREATGFVAPAWPEMVQRLRDDPTPYHELRRVHAER